MSRLPVLIPSTIDLRTCSGVLRLSTTRCRSGCGFLDLCPHVASSPGASRRNIEEASRLGSPLHGTRGGLRLAEDGPRCQSFLTRHGSCPIFLTPCQIHTSAKTTFDERGQASFEEKSVWIQLTGLVISFAGYLFIASRMLASGVRALPAFAAVFSVSVALLIIILVVGYVVAAVTGRTDDRDERDRLIEWRAEARSGWLLATGVIVGLGCMATGCRTCGRRTCCSYRCTPRRCCD